MFEYVVAAIAAYVGWSLVCLELNYRKALSMGIPLIRMPIDPLNVPFQIIEPHVFKVINSLPVSVQDRLPVVVKYMRRGWFFYDKADSHIRYGPAFAFVTPRNSWVQVCESEANYDIFSRRQEFIRANENYKLLEVYGPCISTADNKNWPRHRKVLAAPFNESIMKFVWSESLSQARQMLASWTIPEPSTNGFTCAATDTRTLSLNVLAATGFRKSFSFRSGNEANKTIDAASSYRDALSIVLDNIIPLLLIPRRYLTLPFMPKSLQDTGKAANDFQKHMEQMFQDETSALKNGEQGAGGLMTSFVRASNTRENKSSQPQGLSVEEVFGNIFVINFAGHDTTANTLAFVMYLLATFPKVQDWLAEEIRAVAPDDSEEWDYATLYPKMLRCRAVLLETLRLFPPILALPRMTPSTSQTLHLRDRAILIPPNTSVSHSVLAVHTHPTYWPDPLSWTPSRWITTTTSSIGEREESLITPPKATYFPWSDGPQNCPGIKFSQVEFVAVVAFVMARCKLGVVREKGESEEDAKKRAWEVVNDCDFSLLLRMRGAGRCGLRCVER